LGSIGVGLGSIGVGFGFGVSANIGVGSRKSFEEELAAERVACAFAKASSCRFFNSSASFFSYCFCRKKTQPSPRRMAATMMLLITNGSGITHRNLRAFGGVFNLDNIFSWIEKAQDSAVPLPSYVEGTRYSNFHSTLALLSRRFGT